MAKSGLSQCLVDFIFIFRKIIEACLIYIAPVNPDNWKISNYLSKLFACNSPFDTKSN